MFRDSVCKKLIIMSCKRKIVSEMYGPEKERRTLKNNNNKPRDKGGRYDKIYEMPPNKMVWSC